MSLRTIRGQEIALYPAGTVQTEKREHGRTYRLCQILPPVPQKFEWVRIDNITELPSEERDRLRRTPKPDAIKRSQAESRAQEQDESQSRKAA